ncbi:serine/threonine-protein kinase STY46-like [Silene latifolia]|uniref:serine/threonine-protein kinase STY46-like n=1 Tax=Silene latifolia TaxID=37657 RepID=UPI003D776371
MKTMAVKVCRLFYALSHMCIVKHVCITGTCVFHEVSFSIPDKPRFLVSFARCFLTWGLTLVKLIYSQQLMVALWIYLLWMGGLLRILKACTKLWKKRSEDSWSGSVHSQFPVDNAIASQAEPGKWEINRKLLKIGEKIASGSCGDLYRGLYLDQDVAIKFLKSEHRSEGSEDEFAQWLSG